MTLVIQISFLSPGSNTTTWSDHRLKFMHELYELIWRDEYTGHQYELSDKNTWRCDSIMYYEDLRLDLRLQAGMTTEQIIVGDDYTYIDKYGDYRIHYKAPYARDDLMLRLIGILNNTRLF